MMRNHFVPMPSRIPVKIRARLGTRSEDSGVALIVVLVVIVLLTVIVTGFTYEMQVEASAIENRDGELDAYLAAKSSIASGMSILTADLLDGNEEEVDANGFQDSLDDAWAEDSPPAQSNSAAGTVSISDEGGKINLNALLFEQANGDVVFEGLLQVLQALFEERDLEVDPIPALLDWLDSDDIEQDGGAEQDYYSSLKNPISCKDGPMDSIEELLLIPGITADVFFGDPELKQAPLSDLLTVNGQAAGWININTAPDEVLNAVMEMSSSKSVTVEQIRERLENEDEGAFNNVKSVQTYLDTPDIDPATLDTYQIGDTTQLFNVASDSFRIRADAQSGRAQIRIEAFVWRATFDNDSTELLRIQDWRVIR